MNKLKTSVRQDFPDELRGLALLGIVLVNVPFLGISIMGFTHSPQTLWWDQVAHFIVVAFFQGKFYLLFAFLFGYSAHLILGKGGRTQQFFLRLVGLAILGALHAALFFVGDILLSYALLGVVLIFAQRWTNRALLRGAKIAAAVAVLWLCFLGAVSTQPEFINNAELDISKSYDAVQKAGSFWQTVQARIEILPDVLVMLSSLNWAFALSCFFLGMFASRKELLANLTAHSALWRKFRQLGWLGLPLNLIAAWLVAGPSSSGGTGFDTRTMLGVLLGFCAAPLLSAAYIGWMVAVRERRNDLFAVFRPAGRMSMTLYIGESIVLATIFCGWGAGFFGHFGIAITLVIALLVWLLLESLAKQWLAYFEQGPLEYLMKKWCSLGA